MFRLGFESLISGKSSSKNALVLGLHLPALGISWILELCELKEEKGNS